ncbi:hypothetical protein HNY73_007334 [Argiope bruennichi]|uniref:Uncharacterized protein n=1 Tax=Argiope bruennichi TaxID=94029 RepID=A0A8T0FDM4_ARGBR|nr:hypothetical protein HNY73_007334 [Argiope bruennichi]
MPVDERYNAPDRERQEKNFFPLAHPYTFKVRLASRIQISGGIRGLWKNPRPTRNLTGCCYRVDKRKRKNKVTFQQVKDGVTKLSKNTFPDSSGAVTTTRVDGKSDTQVVPQRQMPIVMQIGRPFGVVPHVYPPELFKRFRARVLKTFRDPAPRVLLTFRIPNQSPTTVRDDITKGWGG